MGFSSFSPYYCIHPLNQSSLTKRTSIYTNRTTHSAAVMMFVFHITSRSRRSELQRKQPITFSTVNDTRTNTHSVHCGMLNDISVHCGRAAPALANVSLVLCMMHALNELKSGSIKPEKGKLDVTMLSCSAHK